MKNIYDLNYNQLEQEITTNNISKFRTRQIWNWLYINLVESFDEMKNLDKKTKELLNELFYFPEYNIISHQKSVDKTEKLLLELECKNTIETVLMSYKHGYSICVTTQIGCNVGCGFCASGLGGLERNLSSGEIVLQSIIWERFLREKEQKAKTVVIMGIGEPLLNYENVIKYIEVINDNKGLNKGARNITLSTSGIVPKIYELANYDKQINLAVSLHSGNNKIRSTLMKINDKYPIEEIMEAIDYYIEKTNRRVTFEYLLLSGINDSITDAQELAYLVAGKNCHINLIPFNKVEEFEYEASSSAQILKFEEKLKNKKIQVSIRRTNGADIDGACGQLRRNNA